MKREEDKVRSEKVQFGNQEKQDKSIAKKMKEDTMKA